MPVGEVVLLVVDNALCRIAAHSLAARFPDLEIIVEEHVPRLSLVRGRIKRFGLAHVAGQLAFIAFSRILRRAAAGRIAEIIAAAGLEPRWPSGAELIEVASVNGPDAIARLQQLAPKVVLVVGTRIISRKVLSSIAAPFINYHDGITPKYRGIHGGRPAAQDNYATFSYLQIAAALPLLERAAQDAIAGTLTPLKVDLPSFLWSHPTLWGYVATGLRRGAW